MQRLDDSSERRSIRLLAHVPNADRGERAARRDVADLRHAAKPDVGRLGDQGGQESATLGVRASCLDMAEHLGEARPPIDFLQEIGDAHGP